MRRALPWTALFVALLAASGLAACQGCYTPGPAPTGPSVEVASSKPTMRLYLLSTIAGAMEPCGCSKNQLGGIDHLAAYVSAQAGEAPAKLVVGAGPMLFMEPTLKSDIAVQDTWKAEAIALAAKDIGLAAWAPGANDWAGGAAALKSCLDGSGAQLLAVNVQGTAPLGGTLLREVGGVKVGIVGVADPRDRMGRYPDGVKVTPSIEAMKAGIAEMKKQGATVFVGLAALPRGEALRLADNVPELHVLVVGKPIEMGDANDAQKAPTLVGSTLVVETANHLQTIGVVDLFVRKGKGEGPLTFADAGGVARAGELLSLAGRIRDLEARIDSWERDHTAKPEDVAARKGDLEKLRAEKSKMEAEPSPGEGSFFRYTSVEVRDKLGSDKAVSERMLGYYKRVNEHNKVAFADRKPEALAKDQAGYVGVEACTECHDDARKVWDKTTHAGAYATLQKGFKEFNLDCVSCHVTGYGRVGGSTVTFTEKLQNVQCEECHGPGSLHTKAPQKKGLIIAKPAADGCVSSCHHSPHVEGFDAAAKMKLILGPGHGAK
ncbi:MAG: multiheme c-type cytochrome [Minicystis sp.]